MDFRDKQILLRDWCFIGYVDNDVIRVHRIRPDDQIPQAISSTRYFEPIRRLAEEHGLFLNRVDIALNILLACGGKPMPELVKEIQKRKVESDHRRKIRQEDEAVWNKLQEQFRNTVLGVDGVDIYPTGMSLEILLNSLLTFEEQREFVKANKKALVRHVQKEMPRTKRVSKRRRQDALDVLPYCDLTEITLTRRNLLILKYDIKKHIQEILDE